MPGIVKVGFTTSAPERRAEGIAAHEGVPTPMRVDYYAFVDDDLPGAEKRAHAALSEYRHGKEWFRCDPSVAARAVKAACGPHFQVEKISYQTAEEIRREELREQRARELAEEARQTQQLADQKERELSQKAERERVRVLEQMHSRYVELEAKVRAIFLQRCVVSYDPAAGDPCDAFLAPVPGDGVVVDCSQ